MKPVKFSIIEKKDNLTKVVGEWELVEDSLPVIGFFSSDEFYELTCINGKKYCFMRSDKHKVYESNSPEVCIELALDNQKVLFFEDDIDAVRLTKLFNGDW